VGQVCQSCQGVQQYQAVQLNLSLLSRLLGQGVQSCLVAQEDQEHQVVPCFQQTQADLCLRVVLPVQGVQVVLDCLPPLFLLVGPWVL